LDRPEPARASSSPSVKLAIPIVGPTWADALDQIERAARWADLIELRLDLWDSVDTDHLRQIQHPCILTVRSPAEGGRFRGSEEERRRLLAHLCQLQPTYIDFELTCLNELRPYVEVATQVIGSIHGGLPGGEVEGADLLKVVTSPNSIDELFDLYELAGERVIPLAMGRFGPLSRMLAPLARAPIVYAALDGPLGEIPARQLCEVYDIRERTARTRLMGVIGDPVDQSPGPFVHNKVLRSKGIDALYLPIPLRPEEVASFLGRAERFNPIGFSVTMPLKQAVFEGEVINTVRSREGRWEGCNTDGIGAIEAIGEVAGKRIAIIGAGGAAKAIGKEGERRGAEVTLYSRATLPQLERASYDILVQATPVGMQGAGPIPTGWIREGSCVLDVISKETDFLCAAKERGCVAIGGIEMYARQAIHQTAYWFGEPFEEAVCEAINDYLHCPSSNQSQRKS